MASFLYYSISTSLPSSQHSSLTPRVTNPTSPYFTKDPNPITFQRSWHVVED
ncbi:hypothetical protein AYX13_07009 [Cryptococcus neoformans]|nr:hypothetical protein AYX13_07009 [Cryptococcus neoformans var. grubii]